jgi:peptide/nickel transport system permease protein
MIIFLAKRFSHMVMTMLVLSMLIFLMLEINGENVATQVLGPFVTQEQRTLWLEQNGYFEPVYIRYLAWLGRMVTGDFGDSIQSKEPVADLLWPRVGNTALLGAITFSIIIPLSLGLGILAGMHEGGFFDRVISFGSILTTSIPEFASAVLMSFIFVFWLELLPGTSTMVEGFDPIQLILPVLILVMYDFGYVTRITRASMVEVMQTAYIRTAILKGLPYRMVILKHAFRNAMIAPFTVITLQINWLLSGVIVVEFFFAYKGFGALLLDASLSKDIYLIEACTMVALFVAIMTQTIADIGYTYLNPRIRFS